MPLVQRTVLEVIPILKPLDDRMVSVWPFFLRQMVGYLVVSDNPSLLQGKGVNSASTKDLQGLDSSASFFSVNGHDISEKLERDTLHAGEHQNASAIPKIQDYLNKLSISTESMSNHMAGIEVMSGTPLENILDVTFIESIVTLLQTHYLLAPLPIRFEVLPDVVSGLGRYA